MGYFDQVFNKKKSCYQGGKNWRPNKLVWTKLEYKNPSNFFRTFLRISSKFFRLQFFSVKNFRRLRRHCVYFIYKIFFGAFGLRRRGRYIWMASGSNFFPSKIFGACGAIVCILYINFSSAPSAPGEVYMDGKPILMLFFELFVFECGF